MLPAQEPSKTGPAGGDMTMEAEFVSGSKGTVKLSSPNGNWALPPGTYDIKAFSLKKTAGGKTSVLKGSTTILPQWRRLDSFVNQVFELKFGAPLVLSVDADISKNLVKTHVWLTGSEGETYVPAMLQGEIPRASLKLKYVTEDGKVLGTKSFACGLDGICAGTWGAPEGFQGRIKIEVETDLGPFQAQWDPKWFDIRYEGPPEKVTDDSGVYVSGQSSGGGDTGGGGAGGEAKAPDPMEGVLVTEIEFSANGQSKIMSGTTGSWELPRGTVDIKSFCLKKVVNGTKFMVKGVAAPSKFSKMDVFNSEPKEIKFGAPLVVTKNVNIQKRKVDLIVALTGQEGETYVPALVKGSGPLTGPKYKVMDEAEKVLTQGKFDVRPDGTCAAIWTAPGNFKGKFRIDVDITDLGVFDVKQEEGKYFMIQ
jgi:hypothetical protein